nr:hypothetical protein [Candidatus Sigynarchaeota archaeon]
MQAQVQDGNKPLGLARKLYDFKPALLMASGALLGSLLIVFFSVVYSHEIFFSDRWDPYKIKYIEIWFFTLSIAVLTPTVLRIFKKDILAWYTRAGMVALTIALVIWVTGIWPASTTEAGYTAIGYAFVENMIPFQVSLHLAASTLASLFLHQISVKRSEKASAFKNVAIQLLGTLLLGSGLLLVMQSFQYIGLYTIFVIAPVSIALLAVLDIVPSLMAGRHTSSKIPAEQIDPMVEGTPAKIRALLFAGSPIIVYLLILFCVGEKTWESAASLIPLALPLVELITISIYYNMAQKKNNVIAPRAYGDVVRATLSFIACLLGLLIALTIAGYYRYLVGTMIVLMTTIAVGFVVAMVLRAFKQESMSETAIAKRYLRIMEAGLVILTLVMAYSVIFWEDFLSHNPLPDPRIVPFPGVAAVGLAGLGIGMLSYCGIGSIGEYHRKTVLSRDHEPAWNANATIYLVLLIPSLFYMGQVFFESRVFEWVAHIVENLEEVVVSILVYGMVIVLIGIGVVIAMLRAGIRSMKAPLPRAILNEDSFPRRARLMSIAVVGLVFLSFIGTASIMTMIPRVEPAHRALIANNDAFLLWSTYPGEKVTGSYVPGAFATTAIELNVTMAAGETERLHLVITPKTSIGDLQVNLTDFRYAVSSALFPADGLNWYYVTYNFDGQEERLVPGNPYQYRGRENRSAAYFDQINNWTVPKGQNQPIWLSFTSLYNTTAGAYLGNITVSWSDASGARSFQIPARVTVLDYQKPIKYRFGTMLGNDQIPMLQQSVWRHGRMGYRPLYPAMVPPALISSVNYSTGVYSLNLTGFNEALNVCARAGYTHQIYNQISGNALGDPGKFTSAWNATVLNILSDVQANLSNTYFDLPYGQGQIRAIDMIFEDLADEPGKDDAYRFRFGQLLDQAAPDLRLLCTCGISREAASWPGWSGPGGVFDVVDVRVTGPLSFQQYKDDPYVRDLYVQYPAENWIYWINAPWPPYPNSAQAYNPGSGIFSQVIQYYVISNVSGFLFWTAGDMAWADGGDGYAGWGCGRYFYYLEDGSNDYDVGYRFELLDDGMEVAELVRHLDAMIAGTAGSLNATAMQHAHDIRAAFDAMFPDFYAYPSPQKLGALYALRMELLQFLATNT